MRRTEWRKTPDLSPKMEWQHSDDPALMSWTVKALDRSLWTWTTICAPAFLIIFLLIIYSAVSGKNGLLAVLSVVAAGLFFIYFKLNFEKTVFVYRATGERLEVCQWQDIPNLLFAFLRFFPFLIAGILLMLLISNPALSIAAVAGPALVGIALAAVGSDSGYKAMYKKHRQRSFKWCNIDRGMLDLEKGLLALSISGPNNVIHDEDIDFGNSNHHRYLTRIYFRKDQEAAVLSLFRENAPRAATIVEGNYNFGLSV